MRTDKDCLKRTLSPEDHFNHYRRLQRRLDVTSDPSERDAIQRQIAEMLATRNHEQMSFYKKMEDQKTEAKQQRQALLLSDPSRGAKTLDQLGTSEPKTVTIEDAVSMASIAAVAFMTLLRLDGT